MISMAMSCDWVMNAVSVLVSDVSDGRTCCKRQARVQGVNNNCDEQHGDEFGFHGLVWLGSIGKSFASGEHFQIRPKRLVMP